MNNRSLARPIILSLLGLVALVGIGYALYTFVFLAQITVSVPQAAAISISTLDGQSLQKRSQAQQATFRVTPGRYLVRAETNTSKALTYIDASAFGNITKKLALDDVLQAEPLAQAIGYNPQVQDGNLYFMDPTIQHVQRFSADGSKAIVDDEGEGQDDDSSDLQSGGIYKSQPIGGNKLLVSNYNQIGVIENGQYRALNTEGMQGLNPLSVSLGGNNMQESFVVTVDKTLYYYQDTQAKPKKIADLGKRINQLAFGGNRVIAFSDALAYSRENVSSAYGSFAIDPIVIDINSQEQYTLSGPLVQATVSTNGTHATLQGRDSQDMRIYNLQTRQDVYQAAKPSLAVPIWINDNNYVYERDKIVWQSDVTQQTNKGLGILLRNATSITTTDGKEFFISSFNQETDQPRGVMYRLSSEPFASSLIAASESLPISENNYQITFANLDQPRLFIETTTALNNASEAALQAKQEQLRRDAIIALQTRGINPGDFTITYTP